MQFFYNKCSTFEEKNSDSKDEALTQDDLTDIFESADMIGIQAFCEWSELIKYTHPVIFQYPVDIQEVITDVV